MADAGPQQLRALAAHLEGLEAAVEGLEADPAVAVSVRRIARSLQLAAQAVGTGEISAGAQAIQRASEAQLPRSVRNFLERVEELRAAGTPEDVHVLVVEDNKTAATATTADLKAPGRTIHVIATASDAEAVPSLGDIDLVVLDLILPICSWR